MPYLCVLLLFPAVAALQPGNLRLTDRDAGPVSNIFYIFTFISAPKSEKIFPNVGSFSTNV